MQFAEGFERDELVQKKKSCKILDKEFIDDMHWGTKRKSVNNVACVCVHLFETRSSGYHIRLLPNDHFIQISLLYYCKMLMLLPLSLLFLLLLLKGCQALGKWNKPHLSKTYKYHFVCLSGVKIQMNWTDCTSHIRYLYFASEWVNMCVYVLHLPMVHIEIPCDVFSSLFCAGTPQLFILLENKF